MNFRRAYDPARALGSAWKILWRAPLTMLLGGFLLMITDRSGGGNGSSFQFDGHSIGGLEAALIAAIVGVACVVVLVLFIINCLLKIGYGAAVQRVMVTGEEKIGDLFRPRGLLLSMVVANLLTILIAVLSMIPFALVIGGSILVAAQGAPPPILWLAAGALCLGYFVVWIWILLGLSLVPEAIAIEGLGPIDALERSWTLTLGNRFELFLYFVVLFLAMLLGFLACCIGLLVTVPWTTIASYESYVRLTQPEPAEGLWIDRAAGGPREG